MKNCYFTADQPARQATFGYWLGEEFSGNGIITMTCRKMIDIGFQQLGLSEISICCAPANTRSRAVASRLMFKPTGYVEKAENLYGIYVDHIVYTMESAQWNEFK